MNDSKLVKETKALIREVEGGTTAHAAWIAIQDRVKILAEGRTQPEVGELLGKSPKWVGTVTRWTGHSNAPFARDADPGRRARIEKAEAKKALTNPVARTAAIRDLVKSNPEAVSEIVKEAVDHMDGEEAVGNIAMHAIHKETEIRQGKLPKPLPKRVQRIGALEAYWKVGSWSSSATNHGKAALEEIKSVDEPMPDDLAKDTLRGVETTLATWELVAATLRGESVGDEAEAFLSQQD